MTDQFPKSLQDKIGNCFMSRQYVTRWTSKQIESFVFDIRKVFEEENIKSEVFYNPISKNKRIKYIDEIERNCEAIGIVIALKDENDNVKKLIPCNFYMSRINTHKPNFKLNSVDSVQ